MLDREKVTKGIDICLQRIHCVEDCPYYCDVGCQEKLREDALALLKEQEAVVRCISCTFYRSDGQCALHDGRWKPEGFCSWAIRKEGQ